MKSFDIKPTNFSPRPSTAPMAVAENSATQAESANNAQIAPAIGAEPQTNTKHSSPQIIVLISAILLLVAVAATSLFFYNQASSLRSELNDKNADLKSAQVKLSVLSKSTSTTASETPTTKTDDRSQITQATIAWFSGQANFAGQTITPKIANSDNTYALTTTKTDYDDYSCALKKVSNTWLVAACATNLPTQDLSTNWGFPSAIFSTK